MIKVVVSSIASYDDHALGHACAGCTSLQHLPLLFEQFHNRMMLCAYQYTLTVSYYSPSFGVWYAMQCVLSFHRRIIRNIFLGCDDWVTSIDEEKL